MKHLLNHSFARLAAFAFFSLAFIGTAIAQTTVSITSFSATSGSIDSYISYAAYKGDGTTDPAISSHWLRIYRPDTSNNKTTGGYIRITSANGYKISSVTITNANDKAGTLKTSVDEGSLSSGISFAKSATYTVNNISASTVDFYNCGSDRLSIAGFSVTYSSVGSNSAAATTTTINSSGITNTDVYVSTEAGSLSASVTSGGNAIDGATVTWSSDNTDVATINATTGVVTLVSAGTVKFTASYAGVTNQYQASSAKYEMTVTDGTPFSGGDVEFDATKDTGTSPLTKNGVSFSCNNGVLNNESEYRLYKNSTTTFSVTTGVIEKIIFTGVSGNAASNFTSQAGWSTDGDNGTWEGNSKSVSFVASVAQVRATKITVTYDPNGVLKPSISANNVNIAYGATEGSIAYTVSNPVTGGTVTATTTADWLTPGEATSTAVPFTCTANDATVSRSATVTLTYTYNTNETVTKEITVTQAEAPKPSISAVDVNLAYNDTSDSIEYTLENATGNVSATVTTGGDWLTLGTITGDEVPFTCTENTVTTARTATVTLSFSGADNKVVTITQAKSPARYTTIPALFEGATSTASNVLVTFNDWVVSGVSTNGKNVFVTDNVGNGFVIYSSSNQSSTYAVGKTLSGTAVPCSLKLNTGYAQLTSLDANKLSISEGGSVSMASIPMADLAGVNTGALVSYEGLTCSVSGNTYTLTNGTTTIQVYTSLYNYTTTSDLVNGHNYNITGIYQQYNATKEILPRSADDIVEVFTPAISVTTNTLSNFNYVIGNGPSTTQTVSVSGSHLTDDISLSLGESSDFEISIDQSTYSNSLTITPTSGTVSATTVYVRMKAGLAIGDSYSGSITLTSTGATNASVSLSGSVTAPDAPNATWDLSIASYNEITDSDIVTWSNDYATMTNSSKSGGTSASNYLGGDSNKRTSSRMYSGNKLTITPAAGYAIEAVVFTATSDSYASALKNSDWTNASASADGSIVTVTPDSGCSAISAEIGGTCGFTAVKVYYVQVLDQLSIAAAQSGGRYWATYYSAANYKLPEGAQAYTFNASAGELYRVGNDGSIIPHNTAVIIIADSDSIQLTRISDTEAANAEVHGTNSLLGSNIPVYAPANTTVYVLSVQSTVLGFFEFDFNNGTNTIPGNKAYYIVNNE